MALPCRPPCMNPSNASRNTGWAHPIAMLNLGESPEFQHPGAGVGATVPWRETTKLPESLPCAVPGGDSSGVKGPSGRDLLAGPLNGT